MYYAALYSSYSLLYGTKVAMRVHCSSRNLSRVSIGPSSRTNSCELSVPWYVYTIQVIGNMTLMKPDESL